MKLKDKVAIITGGGTGIGKAISFALADEGASVVLAARTLPRLEECVAELNSKGKIAMAIQTDIADCEQVKRLVSQTVNKYGHVDILVNNAA